jgi:hypothetical protein
MSYYYTQVFKHFQPKLLDITGSINELCKNFKETNLLICGESHGVRENADLAYTLCKMLGIKQLAIERSASNFEAFIQSAVEGQPNFLLPHVLLSPQASVLSLEMLKAIVTLIKDNSITTIKYVDIESTNNNILKDLDEKNYMRVREHEIAKNITMLNASNPTMVVLGNYHTRQDADETVGQSALQMVRQVRNTTYLKYHYLSGSQYNAGRLIHFRQASYNQNKGLPKDYKIMKISKNNFTIEIPKAHRILV